MFPTPGDRPRARSSRLVGARRARPLAEPRPRPAGDARRPAGGRARRGDRDAGRRPDPRAGHVRRQPGALGAERPAARRARSRRSSSWSSIDLYVNETTRHADVILPPAWSLAEEHFDVAVRELLRAQRRRAGRRRWSSASPGERADWEILLELAERLGGGPTGMALRRPRCSGSRAALGSALDPTRSLDLIAPARAATATASCPGRRG